MSAPLNIQEMEGSAREKLPPEVFDCYSGGAWNLQTLHENQVLSSLSTCRLEDVAPAAPGPPLVSRLYQQGS
jgi:isopentenyl diphosphate isomerase/L-lactate dehydrogenase-like FMN-dependent dehydrogenase